MCPCYQRDVIKFVKGCNSRMRGGVHAIKGCNSGEGKVSMLSRGVIKIIKGCNSEERKVSMLSRDARLSRDETLGRGRCPCYQGMSSMLSRGATLG